MTKFTSNTSATPDFIDIDMLAIEQTARSERSRELARLASATIHWIGQKISRLLHNARQGGRPAHG